MVVFVCVVVFVVVFVVAFVVVVVFVFIIRPAIIASPTTPFQLCFYLYILVLLPVFVCCISAFVE